MIVCIHCGRDLAPDAPGGACRCGALEELPPAGVTASRTGGSSSSASRLHDTVALALRLAGSRGGPLDARDLRRASLVTRRRGQA